MVVVVVAAAAAAAAAVAGLLTQGSFLGCRCSIGLHVVRVVRVWRVRM